MVDGTEAKLLTAHVLAENIDEFGYIYAVYQKSLKNERQYCVTLTF